MMRIPGKNDRGVAAKAASYLHALLLLVSLIALPAGAPVAFADQLSSIGLSDSGEPDVTDDLSFGDEPSLAVLLVCPTSVPDAGHELAIPRATAPCGRPSLAFDARGPPLARV
ncbi:MAG: hypothetical protein Q7T73_07905 [Beijerinckiaceae bacterium]|nr:hypothetical protein [Beijerinckiaceae bacterium]